jgi:Ca2+-binding RTX toxin-like protein
MRRSRVALSALVLAGLAAVGPSGVADAGGPVDTTPPVIHLNFPREGAQVQLFSYAIQGYNCQDEPGGSGVARCEATGFDTDTLGPASYTVVAEDLAGNIATRTRTFRIVHARCFDRRVDVYLVLGHQPSASDDVILGDPGSVDPISAGRGDDAVCAYDNVVHGGPGDDQVAGNGSLHGDDGNDVVRGYADHDRLYGGAGRDILFGDNGVDRLSGGPGADWLDGGLRSDLCVRPVARDVVISCERR